MTVLNFSCVNTERKSVAADSTTKAQGLFDASTPASAVKFPLPCSELPKVTPMSAHCNGTTLCSDATCQNEILAAHMLTPTKFSDLRNAYSATLYNPKVVLASEIEAEISTYVASCQTTPFLVYDNSASLDNTNITYSCGSMPAGMDESVSYSVAFIKAIFDQKTPDSFAFYKGRRVNANGVLCDDILIKVFDNGSEVYCADLSSLYP
jgi:hypothetical protein